MPNKIKVEVTAVERLHHAAEVELEQWEYDELMELRDRGSKAFADRAAVILKVPAGVLENADIVVRRKGASRG